MQRYFNRAPDKKYRPVNLHNISPLKTTGKSKPASQVLPSRCVDAKTKGELKFIDEKS